MKITLTTISAQGVLGLFRSVPVLLPPPASRTGVGATLKILNIQFFTGRKQSEQAGWRPLEAPYLNRH